MSQTDDHWREPPTDRVDPDYPVNLTDRYEHVDLTDIAGPETDEERTIVYDNDEPDTRWMSAVTMPLDSMV